MRNASSLSLLSLLFLLPACGPTSRTDAQGQATRATCDYYAGCEEIGSGEGKEFEDRMECEVKARDFFQATWTADNCPAINETGFEKCLERIRTTSCTSGTDFFNTAFFVCGAGSICQDDVQD
ncbi:DUF6184 family natural product biosynthesis lipoprotein [Archangium lansingense]|uniref:DUF6184 family natural product biosynthesis lipoprotein n=1 Tax=Archangium lansingense TaxID=2995310 RepID=A0ABT4A7A1_9BACT|nr:DUF6184 family natural product biosynthesis lipoprotein [Archangium lansinium]MCY1077517.1 DUF6184 family natural product biosynthesis lipoprotein [Archangium lansinium]